MTQIDIPGAEDGRDHWEAAADAWGRWADSMAAMADKINQPLLDAATVGPGARVLDLAGGAGEPAFSSAKRAGPTGLSVCTDLAASMLRAAASRNNRGKDADTAPLVFAAADMCALPFADASFDAVTCRFGVMFAPDVPLALKEAARVLRPGGRAAFMLWGPLEDNKLFAEIAAALDEALGAPPPGQGGDGLFRFAAPDSFAPLLRAAGFSDVVESAVRPTRRAKLSEEFWRAPLEMSFDHRLAGRSATQAAAAERAVAQRFAKLAEPDGVAILPLHARIVAGQI